MTHVAASKVSYLVSHSLKTELVVNNYQKVTIQLHGLLSTKSSKKENQYSIVKEQGRARIAPAFFATIFLKSWVTNLRPKYNISEGNNQEY